MRRMRSQNFCHLRVGPAQPMQRHRALMQQHPIEGRDLQRQPGALGNLLVHADDAHGVNQQLKLRALGPLIRHARAAPPAARCF